MYKTISSIIVLLLFCMYCNAENSIVGLTLKPDNKKILVSPSINFKTSKDIKEAIDNGIRLNIIVKSQIIVPNNWWFDDILENNKITLEVSYFTLSDLYVVKNTKTGKQKAYNDYQQLWDGFEDLMLFEFDDNKQKDLWVKMRIMLDKAALPTAMQLPVLFNSNWDIDTQWYSKRIETK